MFAMVKHWMRQIRTDFERRRSESLAFNAADWYKLSQGIVQVCGEVLFDRRGVQGDIGVIIDDVDYKLFKLSNCATAAGGALKGENNTLARRINSAVENIFRLRNETARFLIRTQGGIQASEADDGLFYYQALEKGGFQARRMVGELEKEIQAIWREMQILIPRQALGI